MDKALPAIPAKRYFTIGEVSELCGVKPYVLRYWEQEFTQLKPMKRRGNRRYYQHHEVLLIRRIRDLLYDQGFTISGARNQLSEGLAGAASLAQSFREEAEVAAHEIDDDGDVDADLVMTPSLITQVAPSPLAAQALRAPEAALSLPVADRGPVGSLDEVRAELLAIRASLIF
ncbi:MAG: MerR family transcriptional regulator [Roseateles depolymerans]|uniref:MerR family transcriptional regulator n=1 Tax=Roseateles depolymerans TaxID=76731 RepID=A0A2W5DRL8_9BURK|nr:MAG: MerR family transcriptional regulator [Roseateles depolymerans]